MTKTENDLFLFHIKDKEIISAKMEGASKELCGLDAIGNDDVVLTEKEISLDFLIRFVSRQNE